MTSVTALEDFGICTSEDPATKLYLVNQNGWQEWQDNLSQPEQEWMIAQGFSAKAGSVISFQGENGGIGRAIGIIGEKVIWDAAAIGSKLPKGTWQITDFAGNTEQLEQIVIGWGLAQYRFDDFRNDATEHKPNRLIIPPHIGAKKISGLVEGTALCRDLINTPPNKMTPQGLEDAARTLAQRHDAQITVISGKTLSNDFPAIDVVGRAAEVAPRLIDMRWGQSGPKVTLVGKGITFDSGGLDLKPSKAMEMMKKDMGGSATVLGLAEALMTAGVNVQLRVLVPAAENAVSDRAMRPLDVIDTRAGLKVEVGNTDAEGRLVLADALTLAVEDDPDFLIDFATLTGAARVALGTELPALFCNKDSTALDIINASNGAHDPLWRLPLFEDYERYLDDGYVTLSSTGGSGYGGAITAALFLRRFAGRDTNWAHIDVMAWNLGSRPGRPKGGEAMGLRALFAYIESLAV